MSARTALRVNAAVGFASTLVSAALMWLLLTRPVRVASAIADQDVAAMALSVAGQIGEWLSRSSGTSEPSRASKKTGIMIETPNSPDSYPQRPRMTAQVLFGVFVIIVGVLFTLDNFDVLDAGDYLQDWPIALVALGVTKLWQGARQGQGWFGGLFFLLAGGVLLAEPMLDLRIDVVDLWPVLLVFLGGYFVFRGFGGPPRHLHADSTAYISGLAIMGGFDRRSNSPAFEGGDLTAVLGGCEIDLRKASIAPGTEAVIEVFAFWGGIDMKVPEDWTVVNRVVPLMGGIEDKTLPPQPPTGKRLILRGIVVMGGASVKN